MAMNLLSYKMIKLSDKVTFLIVSFWAFPALAQGGKPAVDVRTEREKLAPQVMAPLSQTPKKAAALDEATEKEVLRETQKRLRWVEQNDPKLALAEYRKFWQGRSPHPAVGVQAAMKVAQLRHKLKDVDGALLTCDVMLKKYGAEPTSVLLLLQKADVLAGAKRLDEAYAVIDAVLPELVAMEPQYYPQVSGALLRVAEISAASGDATGKHWSREIYYGVEQVYLRWLKAETIPHTWQMFEALHVKYQQVGDEKRANELLPKAADALLKMEATRKNPEGADVSLEAARWFTKQGEIETAQILYTKIPLYSNNFVSQVALLDQVQMLFLQGKTTEGRALLNKIAVQGNREINTIRLLMLSRSYLSTFEIEEARRYAMEAATQQTPGNADAFGRAAGELVKRLDGWMLTPIRCEPAMVHLDVPSKAGVNKTLVRRVTIRTLGDVPLNVTVNNPAIKVQVLDTEVWGHKKVVHAVMSGREPEISRQILVKYTPNALQYSGDTVLKVGSAKLGDFQASIPLHIDRN
jgi:tetratricopeptide (TPR) repeat protein